MKYFQPEMLPREAPIAPPLVLTPDLLEVYKVAHRLGASQEFVYRLIRDGRLPAIRFGRRHVRVDPRDLEAYIDACRTAHVRANDDRGLSRREVRTA